MGRDHTCQVGFQRQIPHVGCRASSNYGKVVKALALPLGICVWYPPDQQQAVGNLRPPLPLGPKPAQRAGLTEKRAISSNYSRAHSRASSSGAKLLNRGGFLNCPHSVQHQPGRGRSWRELKVTSAKKGRDARYAAKKAPLYFTPTLHTLKYARWVQKIRSKEGCEDFAFFLGFNLKGVTLYEAHWICLELVACCTPWKVQVCTFGYFSLFFASTLHIYWDEVVDFVWLVWGSGAGSGCAFWAAVEDTTAQQ